MRLRTVCAVLILAGLAAAPAQAKSYSAERFDSSIRLQTGGSAEVTETIVFRFEDGTFQRVFRDIPTRRTDGIDVIRATMDGRDMPFGTGEGKVEVTRKSKVRVEWRFAPVSGSTHTFTLTYVVRGLVEHSADADVVAWRAIPGEHDYRIDSSTIEISLPASLVREPAIKSNRIGGVRPERAGDHLRIVASGIRKNGWVEPSLHFAPRTLAVAAPAWQAKRERANALAPRWIAAAALTGFAGLILMWALRQRYDAPPGDLRSTAGIAEAPDTLAPAIAGSVAANGRMSLEHAMAALFALAERGDINIREEPKGMFGQRNFTIERGPGSRPLSPHEQAAIDLIFTDKERVEGSVSLNKARTRLTRHFGRFKRTLRDEMTGAGLIDRERLYIHTRYGVVSLTLILASVAVFLGAGFLVRAYLGWPLLIPVALVLVAIVGFIFQAATTPLSNEGVRRRERWRAYQKHLTDVAGHEVHATTASPAHLLPFAVALGLASAWAKFVEANPVAVPPWFHAVASSGDHGAFPALIAAGGASATGGSGGGGAAGGGASGAS